MKCITELKDWDFKIPELGFEKRVTLPYTWNVENERPVQLYRGPAEYITEIELDEMPWDRAVLYFGCVFHTARVFVNGIPAGGHTGSGYTPFELDITDLAVRGKNQICVVADNSKKEDMLPHGLDYDWADDGGLLRDVCLIRMEKDDIMEMKTGYAIESISGQTCSGYLEFYIKGTAKEALVQVSEYKTGHIVLSETIHTDTLVRIPFVGLKLWAPEHPRLYVVQVRTKQDMASERIGLRTIEVKGAGVYLNGKRIFMKGCEWMPGSHPDYGMAEPFEHSRKCLSQLKQAGCVFTRFHWQQDRRILDWCDENELMVQEEIPFWGQPKKAESEQLALAKQQAGEMVHYHGSHPSIICWGVGNELGGELPETIAYAKEMYRYFKELDGSRLVNYVSNTVSRDANVDLDDAAMYGDIAMWNEYLGLWQPCEDVEGVIRRTYEKFGGMPSMVTEFGLCEPAFEGGDERRAQILRERIPVYKSLENMAGYVWFSLNDYRTHYGEYGEGKMKQRIHGSTDLYGNEKPSYEVFCEIE